MSLTAAELRAMYVVDEGPLDKSLRGIPGKVKATAAAVAGAGLAIGGALGAGLLSGMESEKAVDRVTASLGATGPEAKRYGKVAGDLFAGAYSDSMGGAADAVEAVVSSIGGMRQASSKDLRATTEDVLNFAGAFRVDVGRSAQIAGQLIKTGLADNATQAFDLLTAASKAVPVNLREDVMDAADEYGQFFAALGYDGPEAFGLLVKGAEKGMYGIDKTGDAIKEFTIRATDMSSATGDAYDVLGVSQEDMTRRLLAGGDTAANAFEEIIGGLRNIKDPAKQSQAALALFGTPLEDLSTQEIPQFLGALSSGRNALGDVKGAADRMGDALNDNAATAVAEFKNTAQLAFVNFLGGKAIPFVKSAASSLRDNFGPAVSATAGFITGTLVPALGASADFISRNRTPIMIIAGLIAAVFIPHLVALGVTSTRTAAKKALAWALMKGAAVKGAAAHSVAVIGMVAKWVLLGAQSLWHAARVAAAWVVAMGPVGWVIAAVVGLVALIVANWDKVKRYTGAAWSWVSSKVSGAWRSVTGAVRSGVSTAVSFVSGLPRRMLSAVGNLGSILYSKGRDMIQGLLNGAGSLLSSVGSFFLNKLPGWIRGPFKSALGIASPSKVFAAYGANIGQGLIGGMHRMRPAVAAEMMRLADTRALGGLTGTPIGVRAPAPAARPATAGGYDTSGGAGARGPLFHADEVRIIEGTPVDVARELELGARTRGNF